MSAEAKNKALASKFFEEAWGKGNLAAVDEFIAAEYVMYPISSGLPPGPEGTKQAITTYRTAFPDLQVTVEDIFAAGEMVAFRWSFRGTHLGDWLDIPPTGNHMAATGISVYRIAGGKVVENWTNIDLSPTEEEKRWLMEGGGWPRRSPDIPATERDTYQRSMCLIWRASSNVACCVRETHGPPKLPEGYRLDLSADPDAPALRRPDGTVVARFGPKCTTGEAIEREALEDLLRMSRKPGGGVEPEPIEGPLRPRLP
jgi:predicted ester cyclase